MNNQVGISVVDAVKSRRSVRGFMDKPVDADILKELLETSLRAPSGTNCPGGAKSVLIYTFWWGSSGETSRAG